MAGRRALVATLLAGLCGCRGGASSTPSSQLPEPSLLEIHEALATLEFRPVGLAWAGDERLAVLDQDEQQVVLLDLESGAERRFSRRGEGPGELTGALMLLASADRFLIGDMSARRVLEFDAQGEFRRAARIPGLPIALARARGDTVTALWMRFADGIEPVVGTVDLGTGGARARFEVFGPATGLEAPVLDNPFSPPFISVAQRDDGTLLLGEGSVYRVSVLDLADRELDAFGRPKLEPERTSEEERAEAREQRERITARQGPLPPGMRESFEESLERPRPHFGPDAFRLDDAGRLWVVTSRAVADSTELDLFAPDGTYLGTLRLRDEVRTLAIRGNRVAALVTRMHADGLPGIDVYRIDERTERMGGSR